MRAAKFRSRGSRERLRIVKEHLLRSCHPESFAVADAAVGHPASRVPPAFSPQASKDSYTQQLSLRELHLNSVLPPSIS
jgi:hypothetical protein